MELEEKIELQKINKVVLLKKYAKMINDKIDMKNIIYLYRIENTDILYMQKDNEITFLNNNDDMKKFIQLMNTNNYKEFERI